MSISSDIFEMIKNGTNVHLAEEVLSDHIEKTDIVEKYDISECYRVLKHTFDDNSILYQTTYNIFLPDQKDIHLTPHETTCLMESAENPVQDLRVLYVLQCSTILPLFVVSIEKLEKQIKIDEGSQKILRLQAVEIYDEIIKMRSKNDE